MSSESDQPPNKTSRFVPAADGKSQLTRFIEGIDRGDQPVRRQPRFVPPPTPPEKTPAEYAREIITGFRNAEPFINPNSYPPFLIVSKTILPDKNIAHKVTQILNPLLKQDIADRFGIEPKDLKLFPHLKETEQGVEFGYGAYYQQQLKNVHWDTILTQIKDTTRTFGGRQ